MEMREGVRLKGMPFVWKTNLGDRVLREFFQVLRREYEFWRADDIVEVESEVGLSITLNFDRVFAEKVPFRDGMCLCIRVEGSVEAIYRTFDEWDAHDERVRVATLEKERAQRGRQVDDFLFETRNREIREQIQLAVDLEQYEDAHSLLSERVAMYRERDGSSYKYTCGDIVCDGIEMYSFFPSSDLGIEFIQREETHPYKVTSFAERYLRFNRSSRERRVEEVEKILRAGMEMFPEDGEYFAAAALLWRRHKHYNRAIEYCEIAIRKGLTDDTKSGFLGRLKRLRKEAERHAANS